MLFLCFGYMTGSDWRVYETDYYYGFVNRLVEPGYMLLSELFSSNEINFWTFHIIFKCISFVLIVSLITKVLNGKSVLFSLALWYASYGLFMFINCPFRNLIACGIGAMAMIAFVNDKRLIYFLLSGIAMTFHLSAIILLFIPFCDFNRFSSKTLVIIYVVILIILGVGGADLILNVATSYLPHFLSERIGFYSNSVGSVISVGLIPRLICLFLLIRYRTGIIDNNIYGKVIFSNAYLFLLISLVYYVVPMLFRSALFLGPFYIVAIGISLLEIKKSVRFAFRFIVSCIFITVVITTVQNVYYVPYSNIIPYALSGNLYDFDVRDNYNFLNSPYTNN